MASMARLLWGAAWFKPPLFGVRPCEFRTFPRASDPQVPVHEKPVHASHVSMGLVISCDKGALRSAAPAATVRHLQRTATAVVDSPGAKCSPIQHMRCFHHPAEPHTHHFPQLISRIASLSGRAARMRGRLIAGRQGEDNRGTPIVSRPFARSLSISDPSRL